MSIVRRNSHRKHIGFVSMRLAGTDGVSLETKKWAKVLARHGYSSFYFAGELDCKEGRGYLVPEAHFTHPKVQAVQKVCFGTQRREQAVTRAIYRQKEHLKKALYDFIATYRIDVLVPQNAITIPMHIPLGLAITEVIAETGIAAIAHHHDFYWERDRFLNNAVGDYLRTAYPPTLPSLRHVTINSVAAEQFSHRTGMSSVVVPNVMDFSHPPSPLSKRALNLRKDIGIEDDELMILQPTRIVKRKRIEQAIDLVRRLEMKAKLVVSHEAGDEGHDYAIWLKGYAKLMNVPMLLVADRVARDGRHKKGDYTLQEMFQSADFVTYPSGQEGFGNALVEAFYYKKPVLVNRYSIYQTDIAPKGFRAVEIDGLITEKSLREKRELLLNRSKCEDMVQHNYELGRKHFSYEVLYHKLQHLLDDFFGERNTRRESK